MESSVELSWLLKSSSCGRSSFLRSCSLFFLLRSRCSLANGKLPCSGEFAISSISDVMFICIFVPRKWELCLSCLSSHLKRADRGKEELPHEVR